MLARNPRIEITLRILMTAVMLFNALVPTAALAAPGQTSNSETDSKLPRTLTEQPPVFFDPPEIVPPQQTSPEKKGPKSPVPPKGDIDFTLVAEPAVVPVNGVVTFAVQIVNHSQQARTSLVFQDSLEAGLEYKPDSTSPVTYDPKKKEVILQIDSLGAGQEFNFHYSLTVTSSKRTAVKGKMWLHNVELTSGSLQLETGAVLAVDVAKADAKSELAPLQSNGGWNRLGRVAIHMDKDNVGKNALVMSSPAKIIGKGPALQFQLDVFETSALSVDSQSQFGEQAISLKKQNKEKFKSPAFLEINLDGYVDLKHVPAGQEPYVATYDEEHKVWVKVPILETDPVDNSVTVEAAHFSTWGAGLGSSLPQNGANVLLFDQPYTSLFTGAARYSIPVWTPAGRAGMQPYISLSYSSSTVDGVLGDVQAPWVGVGWNIDDVEIVRKITTDENGYGYKDEYALTLNGTLYQLVQDEFHPYRYFTDQAAFLYIERHNLPSGSPSEDNTTKEWWEVITTDGTHYRLGWNEDSEQLALMYGYSCTTVGSVCWPDGAYASLGYAGEAKNLVAMRWRVDKVSDTHGNYMEYHYAETQPLPSTTLAPYDRESYLESISYTGFDDGNASHHLEPAYQIYFNRRLRSAIGDVPTEYNIWDDLDSRYLSDISSCYGDCQFDSENEDDRSVTNAIRKYQFGYSLANVPNTNGTLLLTSLKITGGNFTDNGQYVPSTTAPTIRFTYQDKSNRATGAGDVFKYPRLVSIDNGSGGLLTFNYATDGRANNSWYNYRVQDVTVDSGMGLAKKQSYTYVTPIYKGQGGNPALGDLIGYTTVTESLLDFLNGDAALLKTKHTFGTTGLDIGRELQTEWLNSSDVVLRKTTNAYVTDNIGAPKNDDGTPFAGWNYRYLAETVNYEKSGSSLTQISKTGYYNDPYTGNLLVQSTYLGNSLYRKTYYEYVKNLDPKYYILDKTSRVLLVNAANQIYSDTRYYYDDYAGGTEQTVTRGDLTLVQKLIGTSNQTIDTATHYTPYGTADSVKAYRSYGTLNVYPTAAYWQSSTTYDSNDPTQSYPATVTNALGQSSSTEYLYTLGVPYQMTDPNGWTTSSTYDGLGRTLSVTPPGLAQPGTWYIYPSPNTNGRIFAPHSVEMQILDTIAGKYRSVWGIYDGAGRMLQTQVDAGNKLLVNTTLFNAQGLAMQQSLPYEVDGTGGNYVYDSGTQFTTTQYDALGRATSVTAPGDITTQTSYDGLTTTTLDPKNNKTSRTTDGLGRMISVAEFSDPNTVYATTTYFYDTADRLTQVRDAKFNTTKITYDWLGRKLSMDDPDMGIWSYTYDSLGNMRSQTDARGQELTFTYDALNRLLTKSDGDGNTVDPVYKYGTQPGMIGMRTEMTDQSGSTTWSYADYGRTVTETRTIGKESQAETHSITTNSDWLGRAIRTIYNDGDHEELTYEYDELGRPEQLLSDQNTNPADPIVKLAYNELGQIATQTLGDGPEGNRTVITNTYDPNTTRLSERKAEKGSTTQLDLSYEYDANGNITRLTDHQLSETQFYGYDFLNRLTSAIGAEGIETAAPATPEKYGQQFEYDKVGNIEQLNNWGTPPTQQQGRAPGENFQFVNDTEPKDLTGFGNLSGLAAGKALLAPVPPAYQVEATATPRLDDTYTVSLLHMNVEEGEPATFTDESGKLWTAAGDAQINTDQSKFGGASGSFDGNGDSISTPDHDDFYLANHDWTLDFWVRFGTVNTVDLISQYQDTNNWMNIWVESTANRLYFAQQSEGADTTRFYASVTFNPDTWYHIAIERDGNTPRIAINGTFKTIIQETVITGKTLANLSGDLTLAGQNGSNSLSGYIDEFRFSNGIARWATNFTPPLSQHVFTIPAPTNTPVPMSTPSSIPTRTIEDANTVSLLHMNGAYGSTAFTDASGKTWTRGGGTLIDTSQFVFGGASSMFDGAGDYLSTPDHANFNFGSGNFTIDFWVKFNSLSGVQQLVTKRANTSVYAPFTISIDNTNVYFRSSSNGTSWGTDITWPYESNITTGTWYHFAFVRNGNDWRFYLNGVPRATATVSQTVMTNTSSVNIGGFPDGTYSLNGWIDEVRISKGVARWTTNFIPPAFEYAYGASTPSPEVPYTLTPTPGIDEYHTIALLHMNGTDGSTVFSDGSGKTWTTAGDAQIDTAQSKFGGSALLLDGNGNYLYTPDNEDFNFGSGDFTVDMWVRFNALPTASNYAVLYDHVSNNTYNQMYVQNSAGSYKLWWTSVNAGTTVINTGPVTWTPSTGTWYHLAAVRNTNRFSLYVNGISIVSLSNISGAVGNPAGNLAIGSQISSPSNTTLNGWIEEFRISKGIARWTKNFIPPSSEYVYGVPTPTVFPTPAAPPAVDDSYTVSLLPMNGADGSTTFADGSGKTWTANGQAVIDATQWKFGGASAFFDGNGDYLSVPSQADFDFGSGNFTIDFWVKFNSLSGIQQLVTKRANTTVYAPFMASIDNTNVYFRSSSNGTSWGTDITWPYGTDIVPGPWYHFAFVRNGSDWRFYLNGVSKASTTVSQTVMTNTSSVNIGGFPDGTYSLNGWLDEVRFSKGIARWTTNFSPPTSEYLPGTMSQSLVAYWDFNVTATPTPGVTGVQDVATGGSYNNAATLQNEATLVSGGADDRTVIAFDGVDDYATVADQAEIRKSGSFSLSAWINPSKVEAYHTQYIVNKGISATDFDYGFITTSTVGTATPTPPANIDIDGKLVFRVGDLTPNRVIGPILPIDTWTLVTGMYDSTRGELRLYINGKLSAVEKVTGTVSMGTGALTFSSGTNSYSGKLDDVRFYNRALTDDEADSLFEQFAPPTPPPPTQTPVPVSVGTYDDTHSAWQYSGTWTAWTGSGPANETMHYTTTAGDYAELPFNGTQFTLTFQKGADRGSLDVYVDGIKVDTINAHSASTLWQQSYVSPTYLLGNHTVRLVNVGSGTCIDVDQIEIHDRYPVRMGTGIYDDMNRIWAPMGNTQLDTALSKFGGATGFFDGTRDYLVTSDSEDFNVGSGDFTVDFWMRLNALTGTHQIIGQGDSTGSLTSRGVQVVIGVYGSDYHVAGYMFYGPSYKNVIGVTNLTTGTWYHVAWVRNGNTATLYLNGVAEGSVDVTGITVTDSSNQMAIGRLGEWDGANYFNGWLDEMRISKGVARWTSNFDANLPASEYTDTNDAVALLHMNGVDGATTFVNELGSPWRYSGAWVASVGSGTANSTMHYTDTVGNYAEVMFNGIQFTLTFMKNTNRGLLDVYVDGIKIDTINQYSATTLYQQIYLSPILSAGDHIVRLVHAGGGTRVDVDAIQIYDGPAVPTPTVIRVNAGLYDDMNRTWAPVGNAQLDATQSKFAGESGFFDGTGDYLATSDNEDFNVGAQDFTVDFWMHLNASTGTNQQILGQSDSTGSNASRSMQILAYYNGSGYRIAGYMYYGSGSYKSVTGTTALQIGTWYHVAWVRNGNTATLYLNGVSEGSVDVMGITVTDSSNQMAIGRLGEWDGANYFNGWLDEVRISKGVARWTSDFTPPTSAYTDTNDTVTLLHMNGVDGATTFVNELGSPWRYSGAWVASVGSGTANSTMHYTDTVGNYAEVMFNGIQFTLTFMKNTNRGLLDVYVDGIKIDTINQYSATTLYQQTYTSPTYPSGPHIVRLVHAGGGTRVDVDAIQIYDSPPVRVGTGTYDDMDHSWTRAGNAQIDTAQSVFGGSAGLFDGNGDYLIGNGNPDFAFGTGDFTIDFWVRLASTSSLAVLYDARPASTQGLYPEIYYNNANGKIAYYVNSADRIVGTTTLSVNTWYHVAVARSGTSTRLFINGVQEGGTYSDNNNYLNGSSGPIIGGMGYTVGNCSLNGWLDELRISKGIARWTSNFDTDLPTSEYTETSSTVTLLHMNGVDGATTFANEVSSPWRYSGTWTASISRGFSNNTFHYTSTVGDYAEVLFNGVQFSLIYTKNTYRGIIDVYVDGTKVDTINAKNSTALYRQTYFSPILSAGDHTVRFVHAGGGTYIDVDAIQIYDTPATPPAPIATPVGAGTYDDADGAWRYFGTWTAWTGSGPLNNTSHYTATIGNFAELIFTGTRFTLTYPKASNHGLIDVYVDGTKVDTINTYNTTTLNQQIYTSAVYPAGTHTVRFTYAGEATYMELDAIQIYDAPPAPVGAGTYDDADGAWRYFGTWTAWTGSGPLNNTSHYTGTVGDFAELTFTGTKFTLTYPKASNHGLIDVYVDGTKITTINTYNATVLNQQTYTSPVLSAGAHIARFVHAGGQTYMELDSIQIDSTSEATSTPIAIPVHTGVYDDTHIAWGYSGIWIGWTGSGPLNNTSHYTGTVGDFVELPFNGTQFTLTYPKAPNHGSIDVYVDGNKITTINTYNATILNQQTYTSPIFLAGTHTVRFVHAGSGTYIEVDAIQILSAAPVTGTNPGTTGLVSWWTLDETGGTRDDSHGANDLTDNNTVGYGSGLKGNAASFVPANQERLSIADNPSLSTGDIDFTLVAHVYLNNTANSFILADKSDTAGAIEYRLAYNTGGTGFRFRIGSTAQVDSGAVSANAWYTIIAWHDSVNNTINIQLNNGTVNTVSYSGGTTDTAYSLSVGAKSDGTVGLDGRLDEIALYKRVLTAEERSWLYGNGSARTYAEVHEGWYASDYTYSTDIPHAVTEVNRAGNFTDSFHYDLNGNMDCRVENGVTYKQDYNAENRISAIHRMDGDCDTGTSMESWSYVYDGDGTRMMTSHDTGGGNVTITRYFFGGAYETTGSTWKKYYSFAGQTVAMRDADGFKYFLSDHLGSVSVVLDDEGTILEQQRYLPFGEARVMPPYASVTSTDFTYTGQRNLPGTGLMDYKARFYSPTLGRFIQPDTMIPDMANPQHWNRFSYVLNNPFVYADPSGHKACELICKGDYVDWNEAKKGSAWEGEWNPKKQKENDKKAQAVIDTVYGVLDFVGSVVNEPYDWASTGSQCLNGHCSPLMLLGLLPLIPSSLGRHADDVYKAAVKNGDGAFAVLGRWMDNPKSYERIAGNLGATHLYSKRFNEIVEIYGAKAWWDKINAPFIQKEIIDKSKPVLLTTPFRVIVQNMTDSTLYKEVDMLLRAGYEPHGSILFPPVPKP